MQPITTIDELRRVLYIIENLRKIAKSLHRLDENACNYGLTKRQETREMHLETQAKELAHQIDLYAYHQGDPRGCSLYLVEDPNDTEYTKGIAITW